MLTQAEDRVKSRLLKYLSRDKTGIRHAVLTLFLTNDTFTTQQIYNHLLANDFDITYRGVSAMVGLMNTRLGILSINVSGDHNKYSLKYDHADIVNGVITEPDMKIMT